MIFEDPHGECRHEIKRLQGLLADESEAFVRVLRERDAASDVIDAVKDALGIESEWTNLYGHAQFLDEVRCALAEVERKHNRLIDAADTVRTTLIEEGSKALTKAMAAELKRTAR